MRLKRIELKGFKSFAKETIIHFGNSVTGIVGPNGSGKSNIVDAIRWVLGEQKSKDLRLESMNDVIFNGTKKRKGSQYAKVTIVFDNDRNFLPSEYTEVAIGRKIDKDGNSEYFLNGISCRLKDIKTLLIDTGIGSHSYAIIALGMVDDILADKDGSRRKMFEQASGISKFRKRKHQSELKLKRTNADLERLEDLLHEVNSQLRSLKKQAKRAEKYIKHKKAYKDLSIELALIQSKDLTTAYKEISAKIESEQDAYKMTMQEAQELEVKIERNKAFHSSRKHKLSSSQMQLKSALEHLQNLENEKSMTAQRISFSQKAKEQLKERQDLIQEQVQHLSTNIELQGEKLREATQLLEEYKKQFVNITEQKEVIQKKYAELDQKKKAQLKEQQEAELQILQIEQKIAISESKQSDNKRHIQRLEEQLGSLRENHDELTSMHSHKVKEINQLEESLKAVETEEVTRVEQLQKLNQLIEAKKHDISKVSRKYDATKNEYQLIKDLVEKLEGFPESIKFLNTKSQWKEHAELFSDILYCKEEYRITIENFLTPYLSYYVVWQAEDALDAIALLKGAQKGKAQFFLNSHFKESTHISYENNGLLPAIDCVERDSRYNALISHLLSGVFIVPEGMDISDIEKKQGETYISHNGSIIWNDRTISGGSSGLFEGNRLGRKKNLEKLESLLQSTRERLRNEEEMLNVMKQERKKLEAENKEGEARRLKSILEKEYREGQRLALQLEQFNENKVQISKSEEMLLMENSGHLKNLEEAQSKLSESNNFLQKIIVESEKINDKYETASQQVSEVSEKYNQAQIMYIRQQNIVQGIENEQKRVENQIKEKEEEKLKLQSDFESLSEEINEDAQRIEEMGNNLIKAVAKKSELQSILDDIEEAFFSEEKQMNEMQEVLNTSQKKIQQLQFKISELKDVFNQKKIQLSNLAERLRVEFELNINDLLNSDYQLPETIDIPEMELRVESLRTTLASFGDVNPMALEAYQEMKDRHELMHTQRQDVIDAQKTLEKTIREIESKATQQFMVSFDEIRANFIKVFRTLFTEDDNCDLILLEPNNPLDSDIEMIAKPKGKKPKSLSQLSGGEKTLTATALLFALYLMKPAPFCIFDEVDAPLDDSNLSKFNNIIREFSKDSQFIIVTHSKHTMAEMDVIYGVFMEEPGVSGVSAVDFREFEHKGMFERSQMN